MEYRLAMFDLNGTLLDDVGVIYGGVSSVFKKYRVEPPTLREMRMAEHIDHEWYRQHGFPKNVTDKEIIDAFNEAVPAYSHLRKIRKDALSVIKGCRQRKMKVVMVSALNTPLMTLVMKGMGLRPYFDDVRGSAGDKYEAFLEMMEKFGTPPEKTFYVGDSVIDVRSSKRAGITAIAFLSGYSLPELLIAQKPDFMIKSLSELLKILKERGRE